MKLKYVPGGICAPTGFTAGATHCGVRPNKKKNDLAIILSDRNADCVSAGLYTTNHVKAAPVQLDIETGRSGHCRAICVNSGIANACAPHGMERALEMQQAAAEALGIPADEVLVGSTGIIGKELNIHRIREGIDVVVHNLEHTEDASNEVAHAILTTDTFKKELACRFQVGGRTVTLGGISKGSGMVHPNMGTTLTYLTTDLAITSTMLRQVLKEVCNVTFNRVSIDGEMSTNDSLIILANGLADNEIIDRECRDLDLFREALLDICTRFARMIAKDGEGAKHLVTCTVHGASTEEEGVALAKSVIQSTLTKTAVFANDANWGRIMVAMGYSNIPFNPEHVRIDFISDAGEITVCRNGVGVEIDEDYASKILGEDEIEICITIDNGNASATCWGCDITYDYIKLNGNYRK